MDPLTSSQRGDARIAVIIPCYRDERFLPEVIASLREDEPLEIVVVDDASDDPKTRACLDRLRVEGVHVVERDENGGPEAARNVGLQATRVPLVFALDADDLAVPGLLRRMADMLEQRPDAAVCFGDYQEFGDAGSCARFRTNSIPFAPSTRTSIRCRRSFGGRRWRMPGGGRPGPTRIGTSG